LLFSLFVFAGVFYIQDQIIPPALKRRTELFRKYIRQFKVPKYRKNVVMRISNDRLLCIGRIDLKNNILFQLVIQEPSGLVITSSRATIEHNGFWNLENVWKSDVFMKDLEREGKMNQHDKKLLYDLTLNAEDLLKYEMKKPQELSYQEILEQIDYHEKRGVIPTRPLWVDFYSKTAFPFATIIFCFLGACLGVSSHRGGGFLGFGISLILSFVYFVIMGFSMPLGKNGVISPFLAGWMQNLVFLAVTLVIIYRRQST
ncbi:LptF/LptG family permease, partial [bacterium]|nr:LptF/LptG family permease [bacterium]